MVNSDMMKQHNLVHSPKPVQTRIVSELTFAMPCETRGEQVEDLAGVSSSLRKEQEAQTDPLAPPVETVQRGHP